MSGYSDYYDFRYEPTQQNAVEKYQQVFKQPVPRIERIDSSDDPQHDQPENESL
jgi:hypothetical protein